MRGRNKIIQNNRTIQRCPTFQPEQLQNQQLAGQTWQPWAQPQNQQLGGQTWQPWAQPQNQYLPGQTWQPWAQPASVQPAAEPVAEPAKLMNSQPMLGADFNPNDFQAEFSPSGSVKASQTGVFPIRYGHYTSLEEGCQVLRET